MRVYLFNPMRVFFGCLPIYWRGFDPMICFSQTYDVAQLLRDELPWAYISKSNQVVSVRL